jgi:tetratricopeptide (TPR) repeat protein
MMFIFIVMVIGAFVISCGPAARKPTSQLDTPEHHVSTGLTLLNQARYVDALREFDLALELSPKFSMAHGGAGLAKAYQGDVKGAFEAMDKAWKYAKTDEEKTFAQVGLIRLHTMNRVDNKKWLDKARDAFDTAILVDPKSSAAYYYMGVAYKYGLDFSQAGQMFTKVLDLKTDYLKDADIEWNLVQKIQRAMPGTITGKKIAIVESITRSDVSALFMEELRIDILYKKRTLKTFDTSFKDPEKFKAKKDSRITSTDIDKHPLKADIEGILNLGVRGLENYPDNAFHPDELITRGQYAMMLEDILIKVTGDDKLATKFIGSTSPFPDLRSDLPYFNAVMVVTSRGIMETKDFTTGEFAPLASVSGVDALLVIKKIKEELRFDR